MIIRVPTASDLAFKRKHGKPDFVVVGVPFDRDTKIDHQEIAEAIASVLFDQLCNGTRHALLNLMIEYSDKDADEREQMKDRLRISTQKYEV
jgi:hypothetical protein